MAYQYGLPLLLVIENNMLQAGGVWGGGGQLAPFTPVVWFSTDREILLMNFLIAFSGRKFYTIGLDK